MLNTFIERPVLSTVISLIIVILGVLGLQSLPVTQYPEIAPPTISVTTSYPGASAETILESVIIPIEEEVNGVEGMDYITSTASNNGTASITVYFNQGVDPDIAAVNVQNRVARANSLLPAEVLQNGVITQKQQVSALIYFGLYSENEDYDATYISNYLNINIVPELLRIDGVGEVSPFGDKNYSIRIWIKPEKLRAYNLVPADVVAALNEQSIEAAPGALGQNSGGAFEYVIQYEGRFKDAEKYDDIVIKALDNNRLLKLKDVAEVELDAYSYNTVSVFGDYPSVNAGIFQTPGSNAQAIIQEIQGKFDEMEKEFPKGLKLTINYNINNFLEESISGVVSTLIEAFLLVFLVVFIFLQNWRTTLIPAIAVPVSIVGTFFFLLIFGYSINLLTLFALVLAIGIVVDDAIVVVEAIQAKLEEGEKDVLKATKDAMSEIAGAIISITLVMCAVFVPVTFLSGPTGVFYQQFGITLIVAIIISAINALSLSPALSALFLKPEEEETSDKKENFLTKAKNRFNQGFDKLTKKYGNTIDYTWKHKWIVPLALVGAVAVLYYYNTSLATGFVPTEDRSILFANIELPPGASLARTAKATEKFENLAAQIHGVKSVSVINGQNFFSGAGSPYALSFIVLDGWDEREADSLAIESITGQLFGVAAQVADAQMVFFQPPQIPGFGNSDGFVVNLLNDSEASFIEQDRVAKEFSGALTQRPEIAFAQSSFNTSFPQYTMTLNTDRIKLSGIAISDVLATMQGYVGGIYVNNFSRFGKQYRVFLQSLPEDREDVADINELYIKNANDKMAPIGEFVTLERTYGPQFVNRFNLFNSVTINGSTGPGYSTGEAISAIQEVAENLEQGYSIDFSGLTRTEVDASGELITIFGLSLLFVFLFLAAQYESYLIPFAVILSLPGGIAGAYFFTAIFGLQSNIYFQIALVMLIGLLAKNAILIVEFAIQRRKNGASIVDSAISGAEVRLRPILMTSLAFGAGMIPLVIASGVGSRGDNSIGTGAAGGIIIGTFIGIFLIPFLYIVFQSLQEKISGKPIASEETDKKSIPNEA
ncbi:efflux RND transporter permease subunit [Aggregatimonas sangjinii]|uniref:Efflux RND transporter permease subunit n=1 Tax=Aggregatimonas sangjinii TaxID=2583587 RepID=A0A5B7SLL3_9FLAO|nr:efflux RND transporter permease subunit [Aggregatimonas sangjinii]QCW99474.1 efflux RND transporter permease subunit [Aggregatimonas sangjinii]